jgi:hypothetical protein
MQPLLELKTRSVFVPEFRTNLLVLNCDVVILPPRLNTTTSVIKFGCLTKQNTAWNLSTDTKLQNLFPLSLTLRTNKLECLSQTTVSNLIFARLEPTQVEQLTVPY